MEWLMVAVQSTKKVSPPKKPSILKEDDRGDS